MKLKQIVLFIAIISFLGSCKLHSDSITKSSKVIQIYSHQITKEGNKITKVFAANTIYFFSTKGCGEAIKVEILDKSLNTIQAFNFKNGNERFVFENKIMGIYYVKVTKKNPEDNHETTLIIEK